MFKLMYLPLANVDLKNIDIYIARDNPLKADEFVAYLQEQIERLRDFPNLGVPEKCPSFLPNSRKLIIKNYIAHYSVYEKEQRIVVTRVLHGSVQNYKLV